MVRRNTFRYENYYTMNQFTKNIGRYMKKALEYGSEIYFYDVGSKHEKRLDKLSWISDVKHEEFQMIGLIFKDESRVYCKSIGLNDKVIKIDLKDKEVKKVFDEKFKIGTKWAKWNNSRKVLKEDKLFVNKYGYECYNFIVVLDNKVIMDALLYGGSKECVCISKEIVDEVDKECEEERKRK